MSRRPIVFFSMSEPGHFRRLRGLIAGVATTGREAYVFTHRAFREEVERWGGTFVDLFSPHPLEAADDSSLPVPCRFVSFAGRYADAIAAEVRALQPALVVHDTFAVVGRVVAALVGVPHVNVCAGHDVAPERYLRILASDPRVRLSESCLAAVDALRTRYGWEDASPFAYVSATSPHLNVYCEPPEFLPPERRAPFEPIAFFGSLPPESLLQPAQRPERPRGAESGPLRVYVSFGTVVWRYFAEEALRSLGALAAAFERMPLVRATFALGGAAVDGGLRERLVSANVAVRDYVDQWRVLEESDVFVTHQGLNSTHEGIFHRVPMLSRPFFWDQPDLAEACRRFGVSLPLTTGVADGITPQAVTSAMLRLAGEREAMDAALTRAREWELAVVAERPDVVRRLLEIAA